MDPQTEDFYNILEGIYSQEDCILVDYRLASCLGLEKEIHEITEYEPFLIPKQLLFELAKFRSKHLHRPDRKLVFYRLEGGSPYFTMTDRHNNNTEDTIPEFKEIPKEHPIYGPASKYVKM